MTSAHQNLWTERDVNTKYNCTPGLKIFLNFIPINIGHEFENLLINGVRYEMQPKPTTCLTEAGCPQSCQLHRSNVILETGMWCKRYTNSK